MLNIKPLSKVLAKLSDISGSTILGSVEVAMILDVLALLKEAMKGGASGAAIPPQQLLPAKNEGDHSRLH